MTSDVLKANPVIAARLGPVSQYWASRADDLVEISINRPGEVWLQRQTSGYERHKNADITVQWAWELCRALAHVASREFSEKKPMLGIQLPNGHRFQALLGPNVVSGIAMSIRIRRKETVDIKRYGFDASEPLPRLGAVLQKRRGLVDRDDALSLERIADAIAQGGSAIVSGATGSGKTTFMKALIRNLPEKNRVITIEDVEELDVPHENSVQLIVSRTGTGTDIEYPEVIDACMRFNPDTVIPGELSVHNAEAVFRLLNTGHGSFLTSIHSNGSLDALLAFARNIEMRTGRKADAALPFIADTIDIFVHLAHRRIVEAGRGFDLDWRTLLGDARAGDAKQDQKQHQKQNQKSSSATRGADPLRVSGQAP
jgi:type IV secretion system protein VirB11